MRVVMLFSIAALIALALQTTIPRLLPLGVLVPDLVMILAVDLGLRHHGAVPAVIAFAMGYATDSFSGAQLGLNAFMVTLVFLLSYEFSRQVVATGPAAGAVIVFFAVLISDFGDLAIGAGLSDGGLGRAVPAIALQAAITAVLAPWVFSILAQLKRMLGLRMRPARE